MNSFFQRGVTITLALIFLFSVSLSAMEVVITNPTSETAQHLADNGYDVIGLFDDGVRLMVSKSELATLQKSYTVAIRETDEELMNRIKIAMGSENRDLSMYPSYTEFVAQINQLQSSYPDLCQVSQVGKSRGMIYFEEGASAYQKYNQAIWLIKVSDNVQVDEDEPGYMVLGEHHSREPSSLFVSMYVLKWLLENYNSDPEAKAFVDNKQIWFMPLVNPNGYTIIYEEMNGMMRKNICDNNGNRQVDITEWGQEQGRTTDGVDLNRNYSVAWGTTGISHNSGEITFCGDSALSEPEVACVARVMDSLPNVLAEMSYHSYSEVVLYSPAYNGNAQLSNSKALIDLGAKIAGKITKRNGYEKYGYGTAQEAIGYSASGGLMDYAFIELGIFGYCGELGTSFVMTTGLDAMAENNLTGLKEMFKRDEYATITGFAKHKVSGTPVPGRVLIEEVDDSDDERYRTSDSLGRYWRFTSPGSYTVTFIPDADTLRDTTITGVSVLSGSITELDFLYPQEVSTVTDLVKKSGVRITTESNKHISINSGEANLIKAELLSLQGQILSTQKSNVSSERLQLPISGAQGVYLLRVTTNKSAFTKRLVL